MRNAMARKYGRKGSRKESLPRKPTDVPKTTNIAGPIQHDAANKEARKAPLFDIFSFLI
jgi:hypothetical protein